MARKPQR